MKMMDVGALPSELGQVPVGHGVRQGFGTGEAFQAEILVIYLNAYVCSLFSKVTAPMYPSDNVLEAWAAQRKLARQAPPWQQAKQRGPCLASHTDQQQLSQRPQA